MVALSELHLQASLHCLKPRLAPSPIHVQDTSFSSSLDRVKILPTVYLHVSPNLKFIVKIGECTNMESKWGKLGNTTLNGIYRRRNTTYAAAEVSCSLKKFGCLQYLEHDNVAVCSKGCPGHRTRLPPLHHDGAILQVETQWKGRRSWLWRQVDCSDNGLGQTLILRLSFLLPPLHLSVPHQELAECQRSKNVWSHAIAQHGQRQVTSTHC